MVEDSETTRSFSCASSGEPATSDAPTGPDEGGHAESALGNSRGTWSSATMRSDVQRTGRARRAEGKWIDIPFIIVSGTIGEETAVSALKAEPRLSFENPAGSLRPALEREPAKRRVAVAAKSRRGSARKASEVPPHRRDGPRGNLDDDAEGRTTYVNRRMREMLGSRSNR